MFGFFCRLRQETPASLHRQCTDLCIVVQTLAGKTGNLYNTVIPSTSVQDKWTVRSSGFSHIILFTRNQELGALEYPGVQEFERKERNDRGFFIELNSPAEPSSPLPLAGGTGYFAAPVSLRTVLHSKQRSLTLPASSMFTGWESSKSVPQASHLIIDFHPPQRSVVYLNRLLFLEVGPRKSLLRLHPKLRLLFINR